MQHTAGLDTNQPHVVIYSTHIQNIYIYFPYFPHMLVVILNFAVSFTANSNVLL